MKDSHNTRRTAETRAAMLEQLAHLRDEAAALDRHVDMIPADVLAGRPLPTDPSFKEIYGLLAAYDEQVYLPAVERLRDVELARLDVPDDLRLLADGAWNDVEMDEIILRVRSARSRLVDALSDLPLDAWRRTITIEGVQTDVFGLAYAVVQHDAELLRAAARRLHESRLTSRDEDLPK